MILLTVKKMLVMTSYDSFYFGTKTFCWRLHIGLVQYLVYHRSRYRNDAAG